jgi:Kef-type K+ transport system membrane component KefB
MPRRPELIGHILPKLESVITFLLLPLFFADTGLRTHMGLIHGAELWLLTGAMIVTAVVGKLGAVCWPRGYPAVPGGSRL